MKKSPVLLLALFLAAGALAAQATSDFTFTAAPTLQIPLGPALADGTPFYSLGGGLSLRGEYTFPFAPVLFAAAGLDADFVPISNSSRSVTFVSLGPEIGMRFYPIPRLGISVAANGGMYAGIVSQGAAFNPFAGASAGISYLLTPALSLGIGVQYRADFEPPSVVFHGIGVNLGVRWHVGAGNRKADLRVVPEIRPVFPLFYSYYDKNPVGTLTLKNEGTAVLEDLTVSFYVKQFMEQPKICWQARELKRAEQVEAPVYALFKDTIFGVTEGTKVAGEIEVSYRYLGAELSTTYPVTVIVNNRNGMTWDDDRKAAAFVTAKDPQVMSFSKKVANDAKSQGKPPAVNANFRMAMALFQALNVHGVGYVQDPSSPYASKDQRGEAVDYLQFPIQTLAYKSGDCDDLSILYSAMLESVGVESAFITVPGHIYVAFNLGMKPEEARGMFLNPQHLITRGSQTWVPVEVTLVKKGFMEAWRSGAVDWQNNSAKNAAAFIPVREAWGAYQPVSSSEIIKDQVGFPEASAVFKGYTAEMNRFLASDLLPRASRLQSDIRKDKGETKLMNRLGVLYARFGMYKEAKEQFDAIMRLGGEVPVSTLINMGNISYIGGGFGDAQSYFQKALDRSPANPVALQGVAISSYELGNTKAVDNALAELRKTDPAAADTLASLGSGTADGTGRAASADKEVTLWTDEE